MTPGAPRDLTIPLAFGVAALLAWRGTPMAIAAARATGFLDRPNGTLKTHAESTPYLGGMAVFVPFLVGSALVFPLDPLYVGVLLGGTLAALLGLMDDFGAMRPGVKFLGQVVIVAVLVRADVRIDIAVLPDWADIALTAGWMLAMMNALNFLDIMDGLAATAAAVASAFFLAIALLTGAAGIAAIAAVLLGALVGYLPYSLPKAPSFLGATLGSVALALDYTDRSAWALASPVLILGLPSFELAFTVLVRIGRGRKPWMGSPDHVALRLRRMGLSVPQVLAVLASLGLVTGSTALWLVRAPAPLGAILVGSAALGGAAFATLLLRAPDPPSRPPAA